MNDIINKIKKNENTPIILAALIGLLAGIIIGFIVSPVKKGFSIGSNNCNNGNNTTIEGDCSEDDDDEFPADEY